MTEQIPIKDLVLPEFQTSKEYSEIRIKMEQNLARLEKVDRYATHEVGHLLYQLHTGIASISETILDGPTIYYENEQVRYFYAGVRSSRINLLDKTLVYTEALLEKLAAVGVAGNVFELDKFDADEETSLAFRGDQQTFLNHCHEARRRNKVPFEGLTLWPATRTAVELEVQKKIFPDSDIQQAKQAIRIGCFGLT